MSPSRSIRSTPSTSTCRAASPGALDLSHISSHPEKIPPFFKQYPSLYYFNPKFINNTNPSLNFHSNPYPTPYLTTTPTQLKFPTTTTTKTGMNTPSQVLRAHPISSTPNCKHIPKPAFAWNAREAIPLTSTLPWS